ncbi:MAG: protein-L-isoaspartate O-methyltransferase [Haloferacaceae archaeon]
MADDFAAQRDRLVDRLDERRDLGPATREAVRSVPRHAFVPEDRRDRAYEDRPLPIGHGQTISAPHMVAVMADALALEAGDEVLEVGTGCGYHAAVTAELVGEGGAVHSVEYVPELAERARERLDALGYDVRVHVGDGREGWPAGAPYDAAYLTCAPASVPDAVLEQVRPGGRVVAPVGTGRQRLVRLTRRADGGVERADLGGVRFVTMQ